jgi:hypothetical protein
MFDDIHRIDSTILKPQQAAAKQHYQGNSKKRRDAHPEGTDNETVGNSEMGMDSSLEKEEGHHTLDLQA